MKKKSKKYFRCSQPTGMTLIEVVASIAIMGTILVGVVLANSRHKHQIACAEKLNTAVLAADELITGWWTSQSGVPIDKSGAMVKNESFVWKTHLLNNPELEKFGAKVVRVEICESDMKIAENMETTPLLAIDLVLPDADSAGTVKDGPVNE